MMQTDIELQPAYTRSMSDLAALFNTAFTGYIGGSIQFDERSLARFFARDTVDLGASQVAVWGGEAVGLALIARQGWSCRLAAMGVIPSATGRGVGKAMMTRLIEQALDRGDRLFDLEVIEQNDRALRLYEGAGFERVRRLVGYEVDAPAGEANPALEQIDIPDAAKPIVRHGAPDLPAAVSGWQVARLSPPDVAYRLDQACVVLSNPDAAVVALRAFIVPTDVRRQGRATRLFSAIFAAYPGKRWLMPAVCPEEVGAALFAHFGFTRQSISQWQMRLILSQDHLSESAASIIPM